MPAKILPVREELLTDIESSWNSPAERRRRVRYSLNLAVRFGTSGEGAPLFGEGKIVNMSSRGVLIASSEQPRMGELVELRIEWPSLLDGMIPLQLIAVGRILRHGTGRFAAALERHEFRTVRRASQS